MKYEELSIVYLKEFCCDFQEIFLFELVFLLHRTSAVSYPAVDVLALLQSPGLLNKGREMVFGRFHTCCS